MAKLVNRTPIRVNWYSYIDNCSIHRVYKPTELGGLYGFVWKQGILQMAISGYLIGENGDQPSNWVSYFQTVARGSHLPWTMLGRICPWMKWDEVGSGANVTLVQGRMWPLLLRGRRNSFRASKGFFHPRESYSRVMRRSNSHFNQLPGDNMDAMVYHCYVVTSISSNFEDALDATFQQPFQSTSSTLWMLRCNTHFEQHGRHFGCYVPTANSIN